MQSQSKVKENMDFLKFMEFSGLDEKAIEEKMIRERDSFRVNGMMKVEEAGIDRQMAYTIFFKKYDNPNTHLPDKFRVILADKPERQGLFLFDDRHHISAKNAFHLLNERAVMQPGNGDAQLWYQMDFNHRDANGDGMVRMYSITKDELDIEKQLEQRYFVKEMQHPEDKLKLLTQLFNGEPTTGTIKINGKETPFQLEVHPNGPVLTAKEIKKESLSMNKTQVGKKPSWEIPIEKRDRHRKGKSL